jgi:hypothetical protein
MTSRENPAHSPGDAADRERDRPGALLGRPAAAVVLALFWIGMVASLRDKSLTFDEVAYVAAGYSQWHYGDFRLQPENGQLPERLAGLPLHLSLIQPPPPDPAQWKDADQWQIGERWLYRSGLDAVALGSEGRMACACFAVALGALVWAWSRRLFGPAAGMVSLALFVLNPTVLANGALMTSDMATALLITATVGGLWALFARLTGTRLLASAALLGALFLTKISALLVGPIVLLLAGARLFDPTPLPVLLGPYRRELSSRAGKATAMAGAVLVQAAVVVILIWAAYGFRYAAASPHDPEARFRIPWECLLAKTEPQHALQSLGLTESQTAQTDALLASHGADPTSWSNPSLDAVEEIRRGVLTPVQRQAFDASVSRPSPVPWVRLVEWARAHRILPEAWIYGFTDVYRRAQVRIAFLNGQFRLRGWALFFPYAFAVKTPLVLFGVILLAVAAVLRGRRAKDRRGASWTQGANATVPLWALLGVYGVAAIASHLNIGQRHLLPVYPPLIILCGSAGRWFGARSGRGAAGVSALARMARAAVAILLAIGAAETAWFFPNYLAYFNGIVRPSEGYRHLVDSSLDWGQDLPAARAYIEAGPPGRGPCYFSYFGSASPDYHGVRAAALFSVTGMDWRRRPDWENLLLAPDDVAATLPELRRQWPDHDVLGLQRLGDSELVILLKRPDRLRLGAGTYLVSASMLQPVNVELNGPWGRWTARYEATYQQLRSAVDPLMSANPAQRKDALVGHSVASWPPLLQRFEEYRFCRLAAYLRHRQPDDEINYSILVYRLSQGDITSALEGPAPEVAPDDQAKEIEALPRPDGE